MSLRRSTRLSLPNSEAPEAVAAAASGASGRGNAKKRTAEPAEPKTNGIKKSKSSTALKAAATKPKTSSTVPNGTEFKVPELPSTPKRKRAPKSATTPVPKLTPTPSLAAILRGDIESNTSSPPLDRPVEPHLSNATLQTPGGTQLTAYPLSSSSAHTPSSSPSKLPTPTATTGTLLSLASAHLITTDARLAPIIASHPCPLFTPAGLAEPIDPFVALTSSIIGQQVSGAAARSIKAKFVALFNDASLDAEAHIFPSPSAVAACTIERLRTAGLSGRKAEYIQGLGAKFASGELSARQLLRASDEEVMESLIAVRGLGKWSVEMFSMFALKRMDVLSTGDLGVQRGMAVFYGKDVSKLKGKGGGKWKYMAEKDMLEKGEQFRPYRSLFMWYMWRVGDVDVKVLEGEGE